LSGPSELLEGGGLLSEYLTDHPEAYGEVAPYAGGGGLPYLFKASPEDITSYYSAIFSCVS